MKSFLLHELLIGVLDTTALAQLPNVAVTDLTLDSRHCAPGCVFIALSGLRTHGIAFAEQAIANGASVVLWQPDGTVQPAANLNTLWLAVPRLNEHLALLANRFYGAPSKQLRIAAVTGTNGKSTTAYLIAQAAEQCGLPAGYIGTVGFGRIGNLHTATHTTPDVLSVHRQLRQLHDAGARVVAMEVSSHALHQGRIAGVCVDTAVFTNLTQDHLDYHGDMQAYGAAKAMLFRWPTLQHQVINVDDAFGRELVAQGTALNTTTYSCATPDDASGDLQATVTLSAEGLVLDIRSATGNATLSSKLLGRFNAENLLAALAVLLGWQVPLAQAVSALAQCAPPPGRMELVSVADKRAVVDYAHTPDALQKALQVLKAHCSGKLICVFGCGGDRDPTKRVLMGRIADELADQVIVTDDNPRTENPDAIIAAIRSGMRRDCLVQRDRTQAIAQALALANADDIVLVAGKGHEDYQIIGQEVRHFSDREVVEQILRSAA